MSVDYDVNRTDVFVVHQPRGETHRAVVQITVRPGKNLGDRQKRLLEDFLHAAARLREEASS